MPINSRNKLLLGIAFLTLSFFDYKEVFCQNEQDQDGLLNLKLLHSFEQGINAEFFLRGTISIPLLKGGDPSIRQSHPLSSNEITKLREAAQKGGIYRVRINYKSPDGEEKTVSTFMNACSLYESGLSDVITVTLDQAGSVIGIAITSIPSQCNGSFMPDSKLTTFNSTVLVSQMLNAPAPDTQTYIQKLEQEKAEKARGEHGDNRSFLAKYWMYIVPLVIFLLISGASGPENQGSGR